MKVIGPFAALLFPETLSLGKSACYSNFFFYSFFQEGRIKGKDHQFGLFFSWACYPRQSSPVKSHFLSSLATWQLVLLHKLHPLRAAFTILWHFTEDIEDVTADIWLILIQEETGIGFSLLSVKVRVTNFSGSYASGIVFTFHSWTQYLRNAWGEFLPMWNKCSRIN